MSDTPDMVNQPPHYKNHPAFTMECYDIVKHLDFTTGNAIKYLFRAEEKGDVAENLRKAQWYIRHLPAPMMVFLKDAKLARQIEREAQNYMADHRADHITWFTVNIIQLLVWGREREAAAALDGVILLLD